jgi:hypothetical protein
MSTIFITLLFGLLVQDDSGIPDFNLEIKPILSNKCFLCHGPDESSREADLRLDTYDSATEYAISPEDADGSELFARIIEEDEDLVMPPPGHGQALTKKEVELIRRWIDAGAKYDQHWSYTAPKRSDVSEDRDEWCKNAIDSFVHKRLSEKGLTPSPAADRVSIIRRLSLDLTGLPPGPEEVDRLFVNGTESEYEAMVDHFLSKSAFGERWASLWLDHARYADSMGYAEDRSREIWKYRDYVIESFNSNKPFDQFSIEQLAGDLFPRPTTEQRVATAFHRNTTTNTEGGTIDEEFRSAAVVDRTNTTMAVWMGTTMACAQCHTHKYDPITQEEYFQFYAFFNGTADNDQADDSPVLEIFSDQQKQRLRKLNQQIARLEKQSRKWDRMPRPQQLVSLGRRLRSWEASVKREQRPKLETRFVRVELPKPNAHLSLAEIEVFVGDENIASKGTATQSSTAFNGPPELAIDGNTDGNFNRSRSVTHTGAEDSPWWELEFSQNHELDRLVLWNRTENLHSRLNGVRISLLDSDRNCLWKKRIADASAEPTEFLLADVPSSILAIVNKKDRLPEEQKSLEKFYEENFSANVKRNEKIALLRDEIKNLKPAASVPVMVELDSPRETRVHIRGSYLQTGKKVERGTPAALHPLPSKDRSRLTLAKWIVSKKNPLTARVMANRFWQQLFGIGIVATSEDFGAQGEYPTHPQLLDHLALEFMESNWDVKALLKQIVMSATYRQSSTATKEKLEQDPNNRWLSRGPRFRLTAEMVRDQALACSGLLSLKMFGPPVQPPQPKSGLKFAFRGDGADWKDSVGEDRYRRAIYTRWRRSSPYPSMTTFDVSNREVCDLRRLRTNTPLQALVTLNDPVYVEAAQALARNVCLEHDGSVEKIAAAAFQRCLIRNPNEEELGLLVDLFDEARDHFGSDVENAKKFANDPLHPLGSDTNWVELAAWTAVANTILNLDEMFLKR